MAEIVGDQVVANFELDFRNPTAGSPPDASQFVTAWTFLEAFVDGRRLLAYGADYDRTTLVKLLRASELPTATGLPMSCVLGPLGVLKPTGYRDLQSVMRDLQLFSAEEMAERRAEAALGRSSKWLLRSAADDALACARVALWVAEQRGVDLAGLLAWLPVWSVGARRPGRGLVGWGSATVRA